jgi:hypothetical protein
MEKDRRWFMLRVFAGILTVIVGGLNLVVTIFGSDPIPSHVIGPVGIASLAHVSVPTLVDNIPPSEFVLVKIGDPVLTA